MPRPLAPTGAWPLIAVAAALAAALAAGCTAKTRTVGGPSGTGGTLTASISASATSGRAPIDVTFTSDVHGGDGPYEYLWTFGDGRTSSAANPHVQFLNGGTFDVRLEVRSGGQSVTSAPLTLHLDSDVQVSCSADPSEAIAPVSVTFRSDARGGNGAFSYRWDFGDGTSASGITAVHTYAAPGAYQQVLTVTSGGASATCANVVTVYGAFHLSCKGTPSGGTSVQFHATPSFCLFNECSYSWDFGGAGSGHATETARPLFTYAAGGTYTASLNASTGGRGGPSASCKVTVTVP